MEKTLDTTKFNPFDIDKLVNTWKEYQVNLKEVYGETTDILEVCTIVDNIIENLHSIDKSLDKVITN